MGMTIAEKILAAKSGRKAVVPGDVVTVDVDTVILFDNNFLPTNWRDILKGIAVLPASDASNFMTGAIIPVDGGAVAW